MQAHLIATGETPKLHPLTTTMPSPMLPVANRPVLALAVEMLARQGFKELTISLYEQGEQVERYFAHGARWGVKLNYLLQREGWGDAGALQWARTHLRETVLVLPGDAIVEITVAEIARFHQGHGGPITAILHPSPTHAGVWLHPDGRLSLDPLAGPGLAFTGAYVIEPDLLAHLPAQQHRCLATEVIPALLAEGKAIYGYATNGYWNPLQTFADYQAAQKVYLDSAAWVSRNGHTLTIPISLENKEQLQHPTLDSHRVAPGVWVGKQNIIHPAVRIRPPVLIGDNCRIGREVELGPYAVIGSDVVIDDEATVQESTVLDRTYVGQLVNVLGRVVQKRLMIDPESAETAAVTDNFLLGESSVMAVGIDAGRLVDMAVGLLLLWWLWPVLLLLSLVAWMTTGQLLQPLLVIGARRGGDEPVTFNLWRLASRPQSWLTRTGLNRLPELINLLRGDITLVGVKPLTPAEAAQISESWQEQRYRYPAGLTGLWYTQTTPDSPLDEILMADTYYVATRTWRTDLSLLGQTPFAWRRQFTDKG